MAPPPATWAVIPGRWQRTDAFFAFLRDRVGTARVFAAARRDYALFRTPYHAGLRTEDAVTLDVANLRFNVWI